MACNAPGCQEAAGYKAPKNRHEDTSYYWFCLKHIRLYNAKWDFFKGMSTEEVQKEKHSSFYWNRPTWNRSVNGKKFINPKIYDDFFHLDESSSSKQKKKMPFPPAIKGDLERLNLSWPVNYETLQRQYRLYARKYHPDVNPDNPSATKIFKEISQAYRNIKNFLEKE